uniref:Uncharacterized protein n=1 Tax=Timema poppense TaxID=170557 RepID=A0A7R9DUJ0_TIMPO|nr:unnamed protein product [Timema poppensis]
MTMYLHLRGGRVGFADTSVRVAEELPMIGGDLQPEDPNSLDQLLQFNENGICSADGDWSMDYWDPYGLDEGLRGCILSVVETSTLQEMPL